MFCFARDSRSENSARFQEICSSSTKVRGKLRFRFSPNMGQINKILGLSPMISIRLHIGSTRTHIFNANSNPNDRIVTTKTFYWADFTIFQLPRWFQAIEEVIINRSRLKKWGAQIFRATKPVEIFVRNDRARKSMKKKDKNSVRTTKQRTGRRCVVWTQR